MIDISAISTDGGTQSRASLYQNIIDEYAAALGDGAVFPPVVVFYDGESHWLADGFHRFHAHLQLGLAEIHADIRQGTRRDAILYSVGANEAHGLRRTNEDKRRAVLTLLNDAEWAKWSDREIARQCAVSNRLVSNLRPSVNDTQIERTVQRGDTIYQQNVSGIGRTERVRSFDPHQEREIIEAAKAIRAGERAEQGRHENDFYPTPESLIAEIAVRWKPSARLIWEPCVGDGRVAGALRQAGFEVVVGDIAQGQDFFAFDAPPQPGMALCTNPPFGKLREFIDHAFAIGVREMCLVLPERVWASGIGREQFRRHRPSMWINMDWREDYLGKGGSPDRALAVAIWNGPCAPACGFDVWTRGADACDEAFDPETGELTDNRCGRAAFSELPVSEIAKQDDVGATASSTNSHSQAAPHAPADSAGEAPSSSPASPATHSDDEPFEPVAFLRQSKPLRPNCQHPDKCAGYGARHCYTCQKAQAEAEVA